MPLFKESPISHSHWERPPGMLGHVHKCSAFTSRVEDFVHGLRALWLPVVQSISLIDLASWCLK